MKLVGTLSAALLICGALAFAPAAFAEEEGPQDIREQIKKQMQKILKLMQENEDALLQLSTGEAATPKKVDVTIPDTPDRPSAKGTTGSSAGGAADPTQKSREVMEALQRLLGGQRDGSSKIPKEIEELIKMIPT